jgi:hypothetical protein
MSLWNVRFGVPFPMSRIAILLFFLFVMESQTASLNRILVISAPSRENADYQKQAAELLAAWDGLVERDFVVQTRFNAPEFSVVLIGKDGGEKLRRNSLLSTRELFAIVDAMPMRRAEMERGR